MNKQDPYEPKWFWYVIGALVLVVVWLGVQGMIEFQPITQVIK